MTETVLTFGGGDDPAEIGRSALQQIADIADAAMQAGVAENAIVRVRNIALVALARLKGGQ